MKTPKLKKPQLNGKKYTILWNAAILPIAIALCRVLDAIL